MLKKACVLACYFTVCKTALFCIYIISKRNTCNLSERVPFQLVLCGWWNKTIVTKDSSHFSNWQHSCPRLQLCFLNCFETFLGHLNTDFYRAVANAINQKIRWLSFLFYFLKVHHRKWPVSNWTKRRTEGHSSLTSVA